MNEAASPVPDPHERALLFEEGLTRTLPRLRTHLASPAKRVPGVEPEDLAQEVLARALRYRESFEPGREVWPWLRRLAERVLCDQREAGARQPSAGNEARAPDAEAFLATALRAAALDAREQVERILAPLSAREREILVRFHQREESVREIARDLGLPEGTIKSHLSRARRRLAALPDTGAEA